MENPYNNFVKDIDNFEGEFIQDLFFYFNTYKLDSESCDDHNGYLIPTMEDIDDMREGMQKMAERRKTMVDGIFASYPENENPYDE